MSNPNLYGDPDTYQGNNWYAGSNTSTYVHTNSGVGNFWFFLLSQGGTGTNDLGNAYTVIGIGIEKAAKIVYKAETAYLTSSANYTQFRNATISAATNIYGANSSEVIAVTNAWYAVGVGNKYVYNTTISGASQMCVGSSATYTVNNAPTGFTWSCSSNLTKTSGSENTATFTAHSKSSGWVGIRVGNVDIVRKNIIIGTPAGTISGPYDLSCNCLVYPTHPCNYKVKAMSLSESVSSNYIEWRVIPPTAEFIWLYVGENPVVSFLEVGDYTVQMRWKGTCGYSQYTTKTIRIPENSFYSYSAAYPNPAGNELIIDREETDNETQQANNATVKVLLYSHSTTKLTYSKDFPASAQQIKIDTSQLPDGIYYLNIISNNEKIKEQTIIVNH